MLSHRSVPVRLLLLSLGCSAIVLACTLTYPFNNDNALFAYMSALLLEGRLPYLGSWDQNFPGILLIHISQILLLGRSQFAFHVWDILLQLVGGYFLFRMALRWGGRPAAFLAPIIAAFYYVQQGLWMAGERDTYVTILLICAVFLVSDRYTQRPKATITGLLLGIAFLFRPTYGLFIPAFLLYLWLERRATGEILRFLLGAAFPILTLLLVYLAAGGLADLYEATVLFNMKIYLGQGSAFSFWEPLRSYLAIVPFALFGGWLLYKRDRQIAVLMLLSLAASIVSIVLLYRHSVYHYHPAMTIFLVAAALGIGDLIRRLAALSSSRVARISIQAVSIAMVIGFFGVQTLRGNTIKTVLVDLVSGKISSLAESYAYYEGSPDFGVGVQESVGEYLKHRTSPGEAVQMFGPYSYPQYFSRTSTASRFQTLHALTMRREGDSLSTMQTQWRREYLTDLVRVRPKYFIVCDAPEAFRQYYAGRLGHEILREDMTEVGQWLAENYTRDTVISAFTIYRKSAD